MSLWPKYAEASQKKTLGQEKVVPIIYDFWLRSAISRHEAADLLDQKNADKFLDFISDAGGGSSYWGAGVDVEKIREHSCIERWKRSPSKKKLGKVIARDPSFLSLAADIFGIDEIPEDLRW